MQKIQILVVGTNRPIMETIARLIAAEEKWAATIANSFEEACAICLAKDFSLALIGAGLSDQEEDQLCKFLSQTKPKLPIIKHFGGGSGLLFAEIHQGLQA